MQFKSSQKINQRVKTSARDHQPSLVSKDKVETDREIMNYHASAWTGHPYCATAGNKWGEKQNHASILYFAGMFLEPAK